MTTPRPFFDTARDIRRGQFLEDAADELQKVVRAVDESGKPGKLTITLTIKPASKGQGAYILSDKVKATLPELPLGETILFATPDGNLVTTDPRQQKLDLKAIAPVGATIRDLKTVGV